MFGLLVHFELFDNLFYFHILFGIRPLYTIDLVFDPSLIEIAFFVSIAYLYVRMLVCSTKLSKMFNITLNNIVNFNNNY